MLLAIEDKSFCDLSSRTAAGYRCASILKTDNVLHPLDSLNSLGRFVFPLFLKANYCICFNHLFPAMASYLPIFWTTVDYMIFVLLGKLPQPFVK